MLCDFGCLHDVGLIEREHRDRAKKKEKTYFCL